MKAIVIENYGGPEQLVIKDMPKPEVKANQVVVKVKAFGINRAETYMRQGLWGDVAKVSGIECVGEVDNDPSGTLEQGQKVTAIMGGMGRAINGSYAEYTCLPSSNVIPIETSLSWSDFAAIPESYATAWSALHGNLDIQSHQTILIRGATSSLGQAAINIAKKKDMTVLATTRNPSKKTLLKSLGADVIFLEDSNLSETIRKAHPEGIHHVLEIVGNTTLQDSLKSVKKNGRVCVVGLLGGGAPIESFNSLFDIPSGVHLSSFASIMLGTEYFPLSNIPMQDIVNDVVAGTYKARPVKVFPFEDIVKAHQLMESNEAGGKIVVSL